MDEPQGQPPSPEDLEKLFGQGAGQQGQQVQITPAKLEVVSFRGVEIVNDVANGNRGIQCLCAAPILNIVLWWKNDVAAELGKGLMAPSVALPQNGAGPNG